MELRRVNMSILYCQVWSEMERRLTDVPEPDSPRQKMTDEGDCLTPIPPITHFDAFGLSSQTRTLTHLPFPRSQAF